MSKPVVVIHEDEKKNTFLVIKNVSDTLCDKQMYKEAAFFTSRALLARNSHELIKIAENFVLISSE